MSEMLSSASAPVAAAESAPRPGPVPVTERILERLPGRRWAWTLAWAALCPALLPISAYPGTILAALGLAAGGDWAGAGSRLWAALVPLGPAILAMAYAVPHALWGARSVARRADEASRALASAPSVRLGIATLTRGIGNVAGPVGLAAGLGTAAAAAVASWRGAGHLVLAPAFALVLLPQLTLLWVYLCVMLGLFRLGSHPLALEQYSGDRSLGLRPVGQVAFAGVWAFASNFVPLGLLALGGHTAVDVFVVSAFLLAGTFAIFASLLRVRAQMAAARRIQVARARELYAEAYEPLRRSRSVETLARQAPLLAAAEALEKRAEGIQEWPFGDAVLARMVVIASSVLAAVIARVAQYLLGL